jgi:hypothetical protein
VLLLLLLVVVVLLVQLVVVLAVVLLLLLGASEDLHAKRQGSGMHKHKCCFGMLWAFVHRTGKRMGVWMR